MPIGWRQQTLLYSTDPGALSASVNHQAADALVAAAANVWNLPVANITLAQGPALAEDVNGQNVYLSANGVVFPADVSSSNAAAIPLAILYDQDGAITDTLLGAGASAPLSCRQNAVTESVDAFDPDGYILHAILIVNGRCTGPAPEQQLQLQYQLQRAFGRVLGLAWSQVNDNVFTGTPTPTYQQALHWPIMHPLDVICGPYTYQCLPSPFTLRSDDIASMVLVYPVSLSSAAPGKSPSLAAAVANFAQIRFPTGEGMGGVNLLAQVVPGSTGVAQPWVEVSSVTGYGYRRSTLSPFVAPDPSVAGSFGSSDQNAIASTLMAYLPIVDGLSFSGMSFTSEALNPLYVGAYSVGPYSLGVVEPSGSALAPGLPSWIGSGQTRGAQLTVADAASTCGNGADGTATVPVPADPSGWWTGLLCGYGHAAYRAVAVRPARTFTVEVTALDANSLATTSKLRPVIGVFAASDAPTALPSLAVAPEPFQAASLGMTSLIAATGQASSIRLGIADQRNDGRPDFSYRARMFYGDTVSPAVVGAAGATAVVQGTGFRAGNTVNINGVAANVTSWTSTTMVMTLPSMAQAGASDGVPVDVELTDLQNGAVATLSGAITYSRAASLPNTLNLISAQSGGVYTGDVVATLFAVQETLADGVTPVAGAPVVFSISSGSGAFSACGRASCTVLTDSHGLASTSITPLAAGTLTMQAVDGSHSTPTVTASFPVIAAAGSMTVLSAPSGNLYTTQLAATPFSVQILSASAAPMPGRAVRFTVIAGSATLGSCFCADMTVATDGNGQAQVQVTPMSAGTVTLRAVDGDRSQQISLNALSYGDTMQVLAAPASGVVAGQWAGNFTVSVLHGDGTPDSNEAVTLSGPAAVAFGRCGQSQCLLTTDSNGVVTSAVKGLTAGTFTIAATFGTLVKTVSFTVASAAERLTVTGLPLGTQVVGQETTQPFAVRLTDAFGNPIAGSAVTFEAPAALAIFPQCNSSECLTTTDSNGTASLSVEPLAAGQIAISADADYLVASGSFTAAGTLGFLTVVQQPGAAGAAVDVPQTFVLKLLGPDGSTPMANQPVYLRVLSGNLTFTYCGSVTFCGGGTDQNGLVTLYGTPYTLGMVTLQAYWRNLTTNLSFSVHAASDVLTVLTAPANGTIAGSVAALPLAMQVTLPDGVTAVPAGRSVALSVSTGSATFQACGGAAACSVMTDAQGRISTLVTPLAAGTISLLASEGGGNQTATFIAAPAVTAPPPPPPPPPLPDTISLISAPTGTSPVGQANATAFAVKLLQGDGITPAAGKAVAFSVTAGSATLAACGTATCTIATDASGIALTTVTPTIAGTVTIAATEANLPTNTLSATFNAVEIPIIPPPVSEMLALSVSPGVSAFLGTYAATPFTVLLTLTDGITPVSGVPITFSNVNGAGQVTFAACAAASCTVNTSATGLASTRVLATGAGAVILAASAPSPGAGLAAPQVTTAFQVVANQLSLIALEPDIFLAEASTTVLDLTASALQNGAPPSALPLLWQAVGAVQLLGTQTLTQADGSTTAQATIGPLGGGAQATITACAWTNTCATFNATGVSASSYQINLISGGWQTLSRATGTPFAPVVAEVTDGAGHAVIGAAVSVYQQLTAFTAACPSSGRCPAEPVLAAQVSVAVTDRNGTITVSPLTGGSASTQTRMAFSAGIQGFATTVLTSLP